MTEYGCNSHHAHVCVSPEEGLRLQSQLYTDKVLYICTIDY